MRQLPLPVQLRASSTFANFYRGPNDRAIEQLIELDRGSRLPAVWLYGPTGVGKTHLLQAVCARAGERALAAAYFPLANAAPAAELFPEMHPEMLLGCDSLSFVCLDDFEHIAGRAAWEHAIFRLYTELEDSGGRLMIATTTAPATVRIALKDLASRLAAGTILSVQSLSDDELSAAITLRATQLGLELPTEVAQYLLRRLPRDMATLCDTLATLDRASLATQRRLTVPFVREVVEGRQKI